MQAFSELLENLYYTASSNEKQRLLIAYLQTTPNPDRGWAIAALAGTLRLDFFKRQTVKQLMLTRIDPELFAMSYDYVGEISETVAHLWPETNEASQDLPTLGKIISDFQHASKHQVSSLLADHLSAMTPNQRWALIKLGTRGLRIGMSARSVKKALAVYGGKPIEEIEQLWHAMAPPYIGLFDWLDGKQSKPDISHAVTFHPVMLATPIEPAVVVSVKAALKEWQIEHKFDGIRVQLVCNRNGKALFSRNGDDIGIAFPDVLASFNAHGVLDGELLIMNNDGTVGSFHALQQRLNRKKTTNALLANYPAGVILYDILKYGERDISNQPLTKRRAYLARWVANNPHPNLRLSEVLSVSSASELDSLYEQAANDTRVEGLMLKRQSSLYLSGRPAKQWYKWKRAPKVIDAVIMYAQRGHGKRSSYYSDYTFGVWQDNRLLPVGKAYSGFTDAELKQLDQWVRRNAIGRFGPVREVAKALVLEVAFDAVHPSSRHKSGVALRFPRIHRIRWDKPAEEADTLDNVKSMIIASTANIKGN